MRVEQASGGCMFLRLARVRHAGHLPDRQGGLQMRYLNEPSLTVGLVPRGCKKFVHFVYRIRTKIRGLGILPRPATLEYCALSIHPLKHFSRFETRQFSKGVNSMYSM